MPDPADPKTRIPVPEPYLHPRGRGLAVFFPALLVHSLDRSIGLIPEVFSVRTTDADGITVTWQIESRDTNSGILWSDVVPPKASFAILLSKPVSGGVSVVVELVDDKHGDEVEVVVNWRGMVAVDNVDECIEDAILEKGGGFCLKGEYVSFHWWIVD